jgi:hypothetical protein
MSSAVRLNNVSVRLNLDTGFSAPVDSIRVRLAKPDQHPSPNRDVNRAKARLASREKAWV